VSDSRVTTISVALDYANDGGDGRNQKTFELATQPAAVSLFNNGKDA